MLAAASHAHVLAKIACISVCAASKVEAEAYFLGIGLPSKFAQLGGQISLWLGGARASLGVLIALV